ncbi:hypothetical protein C1H46_013462 [Malus baccata]|uniref:Uncharacterized protein n=1 Tax=Malus baccata TaxID=106549 RepID=A0A540MQ73_MALBA|nr:hypothetical protein C1H46_013462 [Malus baccata]
MDLLHHQKGSSTDLGADAFRGKLLTLPCRFMPSGSPIEICHTRKIFQLLMLVLFLLQGPEICEKNDDGSTGTAPNRISRKGNHHGVGSVLDPSFKGITH